MRVLFANDYPMAEARDGWRQGVYPAQHLWGTATLPAGGIEVVDLTRDVGRRAERVQRVAQWVIGDVGQELRALTQARRAPAVLYAGDPVSARALTFLRARTRRVPPSIVVVHGRPRTALARRAIGGADRVISFSSAVTAELVAAGLPGDRIVTTRWGPDLSFAGYAGAGDDGFVLSTGKTRRDLGTLFSALEATGAPARVYVPDDASAALAARLPNVVALTSTAPRRRGAPLTYAHVIEDLRRAAVVAIPLTAPTRGYGLTELNDAVALGKPVVMTRNPYIDVDVERVGCGIVVEPGDDTGWKHALERLLADPALRSTMGHCGRAWAAAEWNAERFEADLHAAIVAVAP